MPKLESLQEPFLNKLRIERAPVNVYLLNGKKLHGRIGAFDQYIVILENDIAQMIYKHAISTICQASDKPEEY